MMNFAAQVEPRDLADHFGAEVFLGAHGGHCTRVFHLARPGDSGVITTPGENRT